MRHVLSVRVVIFYIDPEKLSEIPCTALVFVLLAFLCIAMVSYIAARYTHY
jgi:hypothetical protein